ncbi:hypothetical protein GTP90_35250, partial [Rugamonas sp. FT81W]|nr:hypothetical protein [Duganella vulcania]
LYLDSARLAAAGLGGAQQQLLDLARRAEDAIARIDRVKDMIDLTAELLALGAALATGKPDHLAAPLEKLKHHLAALPAPG